MGVKTPIGKKSRLKIWKENAKLLSEYLESSENMYVMKIWQLFLQPEFSQSITVYILDT